MISVVIPPYDKGRYIKKAVCSVLNLYNASSICVFLKKLNTFYIYYFLFSMNRRKITLKT